MANSVIAQTGDVNSGYWNPAGLVHLQDKQISLMHASYFANIAQYDYAAFAMPVDERSALGISVLRFGVDDIMNTTELIDQNGNIDYNRISLFSAADYAFNISYARQLSVEGLSLGVNARVVRRVIGDFAKSWGFGIDLGCNTIPKTGNLVQWYAILLPLIMCGILTKPNLKRLKELLRGKIKLYLKQPNSLCQNCNWGWHVILLLVNNLC